MINSKEGGRGMGKMRRRGEGRGGEERALF